MPDVSPALPADYLERVYAGVLGKIIGVYLGRPLEQWSHQAIVERLGEVDYYVHEKLKQPLIVTDDDISGTFTFIRALEDNGCSPQLTARQIGHTWLNYIIPQRAILWWGGMGVSSEHTAYQRLVSGIDAPASGSIALNGPVVAEQIGAQIFIDGWGLVNPGDPERAAAMARKAGSVSHDGEALHGAVVVATMVAQAFVEKDLDRLYDTVDDFIPPDCRIRRLIDDLRGWRARFDDWHRGLELIHEKYSYEKFGGGCHMVPNHAVIQLALLWGGDHFQRSLMLANTAGYDTDCNSGNVGCINGVRLGLAGIDNGPDFRGPVADRMLLPTADGGGCVTDAASQAVRLAAMGARLRGRALAPPKSGKRYHFALPGSVQGFVCDASPESAGAGQVGNSLGGFAAGERCLKLAFDRIAGGRVARASTQVFVTPEQAGMGGYSVLASPSLYAGQTVSVAVKVCAQTNADVVVRLCARHYTAKDQLARVYGESKRLSPGQTAELAWTVPDTGGHPYCDIGVEVAAAPAVNGAPHAASGVLFLDHLDVVGTPRVTFRQPDNLGNRWSGDWAKMWFTQWVNAADNLEPGYGHELLRIAHNTDGGLALCGHRDWTNYTLTTRLHIHLARRALLAVRVQGLRRYVALAIEPSMSAKGVGRVLLIRRRDDEETVLAELEGKIPLYTDLAVTLTARGREFAAQLRVHGEALSIAASDDLYGSGGIGVGVDQGRVNVLPMEVSPA